ncbi:Glycosyltransferase, family GT47 [Ectocarpus siliculosus]|uniref:Glycosyltransferase, family GT47 n=1 Tax=Ectocarpus siliculosus TaxID=2880 RepID=D7FYQ6_ECTSI|nr:Glycosyltransferase, family GT47 [Ectocarpus siliculosus]|eukprot:CBJ32606.1 Glycosyltransferase, family GT47 [Ectocarpus siliculosus]
MPFFFPRPSCRDRVTTVLVSLSRRRALHLLWAAPCVLLGCAWSLGWAEFSQDAVQPGSSNSKGNVLLLHWGGDDDDPGLNDDRYPIPDRMEPVPRPPEVWDYLTGADIMNVRLEALRLNGTAAADQQQQQHQESKVAAAAVVEAAEALGDNKEDVRPVDTAFAPRWKGMPTRGSRCSSIDMAAVAPSMACGAPLAEPCFDRSRCRPHAPGGSPSKPSIYVFDVTCSLADSSALPPSNESLVLSHTWREAARDAGVLSETYWDACLFLHVNKRLDHVPCPAEKPLWNGGKNHVMVDLTDRARDKKPWIAGSAAMDASSNMRSCFYRSGYDFAVPLRHQRGFGNLTDLAPWHRDYFLTMKGNLYLSGVGYDERMSIVPLHSEPEGVIMGLNCFEMHDEHLLPENEEFCLALNETASRHEFKDLMNTTFGLVPAGRQPATYRLAEVMSAGAIPVFVSRDMVRPLPERVDWPTFSFSFPPEEVGPAMMDTLRSVAPAELLEMQRKSVQAFYEIFGEEPGYDRIARVVVDELVLRVGYHR